MGDSLALFSHPCHIPLRVRHKGHRRFLLILMDQDGPSIVSLKADQLLIHHHRVA